MVRKPTQQDTEFQTSQLHPMEIHTDGKSEGTMLKVPDCVSESVADKAIVYAPKPFCDASRSKVMAQRHIRVADLVSLLVENACPGRAIVSKIWHYMCCDKISGAPEHIKDIDQLAAWIWIIFAATGDTGIDWGAIAFAPPPTLPCWQNVKNEWVKVEPEPFPGGWGRHVSLDDLKKWDLVISEYLGTPFHEDLSLWETDSDGAPQQEKVKVTSCSSTPDFSFFKLGDSWMVGAYGRESMLKDLKGMAYIHFLLQYPHKAYSAATIYHLGKDQVESPATLTKSKDGTWKHELLAAPTELPMSNQQKIDSTARREAINAIKNLRKAAEEADDTEERQRRLEEAAKFEKYVMASKLRHPMQRSQASENVRTNVQKGIRAAKDRLEETFRDRAPDFLKEINAISTGDTCGYFSPGNHAWKLAP
jgi:hypothetical protein